MKKKVFTIGIAFVILISCIAPAFSSLAASFEKDFTSDYYRVSYTKDNGLPDDMIFDIEATDDMLWFATDSGLTCFDGKTFSLINKENNSDFNTTSVRNLYKDSQGRLWIASNDAGLFCKTGNGFKVYDISKGASSNSVQDVVEKSDGTIVAATADGVYSIDSNDNIRVLENKTSVSVQVKQLAIDNNDTILCSTSTGMMFFIKDDTITQVIDLSKDIKGKVSCVYFDNTNNCFKCATNEGEVFDLIFNGSVSFSNKIDTGEKEINKLYKDNLGNWWIISLSGLGYLDSYNNVHNVKNMNVENCSAVFMDFQGNYWFSSSNKGLLELCKSSFIDVNSAYSLEGNITNCLTELDDNLYIGTDDGLTIVNLNSGKQVHNSVTDSFTDTSISSFAVDKDKNLIISTFSEGIFVCSKGGGVKEYTTKNGLVSNQVNRVNVLKNNDIAVNTDKGLSIIRDRKIIANYTEVNGLIGNATLAHTTDKVDGLIVGTESNGAYKIFNGKISSYNETFNSITGMIKCIENSSDKTAVWVGVGSRLYYASSENKIKEITKVNLLHNIVDIFHAPDGKLWIVSSEKVIVTSEENLLDDKAELEATVLDKSNGLTSNINIYAKNYMSDSGLLYLCCNDGVKAIDTQNYSVKVSNPKLQINGISTENGKVPFSDNVIVEAESQRLVINISALSYVPYESYSLKYQLEGMDTDFCTVNADATNEIVYTNLDGGHYKFNVYLINTKSGECCDSMSFEINKEYSYIEQSAFKVIVVIFVFFLIVIFAYLIVLVKARKNRKDKLKYKTITDQTMLAFAKAIDAKDQYTKGHSERVAKYSVEIARRYGIDEDRLNDIYYSGLLHDIGKIGVPDSILKKPDKLTEEEFEVIKTHTLMGADILSEMTDVKNVQFSARDHHEKFDGTGYPRGISGNLISFEGRIVGAADAYDAMATDRGYDDSHGMKYIRSEIERQSGTQFDPKIAEILISMIDDGFFDEQ